MKELEFFVELEENLLEGMGIEEAIEKTTSPFGRKYREKIKKMKEKGIPFKKVFFNKDLFEEFIYEIKIHGYSEKKADEFFSLLLQRSYEEKRNLEKRTTLVSMAFIVLFSFIPLALLMFSSVGFFGTEEIFLFLNGVLPLLGISLVFLVRMWLLS